MNKYDLILKILSIVNINVENLEELDGLIIKQELLKQPDLISKFNENVPELKIFYNSSKLTCLHKNNSDKQKFPAVNMVRQLLKCNNLKLEPFLVSNGYNKATGKKLYNRFYKIRLIQIEKKSIISEDIICGKTMKML